MRTGRWSPNRRRPATLAAGQTAPTIAVLEIAHPHLLERAEGSLSLYRHRPVSIRGNDVVDEVVQPLGLRTVAITAEQGFLLNGRPYPIHGVSRHQDRFNQGGAVRGGSPAGIAMILDMGVTAVRNTHYPQSGAWHELADRNGLLMWDEVSLVRTINASAAFTANSELEAREMILQLYNHPAIAFWGLFNELDNLPTPPPETMLKG